VNARFYAPDAREQGDVISLPDVEAQHLRQVLRLGAGAAVRVFDGRGHEFDGVVTESRKGLVSVRVAAPLSPAPEPLVAVTLAQAILKGDKMDDVVRDAVMMGASTIQPLVTDRSEVSLASLRRGSRVDRWRRIAVSSTKQCGRALVPAVLDPLSLDDLLSRIADNSLPSRALMFVEPAASAEAIRATDFTGDAPPEATVVIGPEGGWTPREIERAASRCALVTLGGRTLRADAMPIVALSVLFTVWKDY
jgi:16S rRNA (uracil1498-N3)-methyltransferase